MLPELKTTRERIEAARLALESLQSVLKGISSLIPVVDLTAPDTILTDLIESADSLDSEIANAEQVARQASTFVSDTSFLLGGDLTETRESLEGFLEAVENYEGIITDWRVRILEMNKNLPLWIDRASLGLTIFLAWFALSQLGLFAHGLTLLRGYDPLTALRRK
jgi:hypothetical protein